MSAKAKNLRKQIEDILRSKKMDNTRKARLIDRRRHKLKNLGYVVDYQLAPEGKRGAPPALRRIGDTPRGCNAPKPQVD